MLPHAHSFVDDLSTPVLTRLTLLCCSGKVQGLLTLVSICLVAGGMDRGELPSSPIPCPVIPGEGGRLALWSQELEVFFSLMSLLSDGFSSCQVVRKQSSSIDPISFFIDFY